jgi:hypothetical protein
MADKKIKVLVVPSDTFGVGLYRSRRPHEKLQQLYGDEFEVEINMNPNWADFASFEKYDIIHFHKGLFNDEGQKIFHNALRYFKEHNITTVMDIDDNWDVGQYHPLYLSNKAIKAPEKITTNFTLVDYVTTTTTIFGNKIKKWNKNVKIFATNLADSIVSDLKAAGIDPATFSATSGHIVLRVLPGGGSYYVYVLDDSDFNYRVKDIYGPFTAS